jgi:hypothetical protein
MLVSLQYDPERPVDAEDWLALDEQERIEAVRQYHRRSKIRLPNENLHAITHAAVESQIASGEYPVRGVLNRLMKEGLDRHDAIHAIGSVLAEYMFAVVAQVDFDFATEDYVREIQQLTARSWRKQAS